MEAVNKKSRVAAPVMVFHGRVAVRVPVDTLTLKIVTLLARCWPATPKLGDAEAKTIWPGKKLMAEERPVSVIVTVVTSEAPLICPMGSCSST